MTAEIEIIKKNIEGMGSGATSMMVTLKPWQLRRNRLENQLQS